MAWEKKREKKKNKKRRSCQKHFTSFYPSCVVASYVAKIHTRTAHTCLLLTTKIGLKHIISDRMYFNKNRRPMSGLYKFALTQNGSRKLFHAIVGRSVVCPYVVVFVVIECIDFVNVHLISTKIGEKKKIHNGKLVLLLLPQDVWFFSLHRSLNTVGYSIL